MKNIAIIAGGDSGEFEISVLSAQMVSENINADKFNSYLIEIKGSNWIHKHATLGDISIDKNDFSLTIGNDKIVFDKVFNVIHGTPGEDGKILGYFEMLGIPFTSSSAISSGLTFNKAYCNQVVKNAGYKVANSVHLFKDQEYSLTAILDKIKMPCFVKPNQGGSSVGMSKVKEAQELQAAIDKAFAEDTEVLIEEFIEGRELTIGVLRKESEILVFPITEIISKNEFFDYEAKYDSSLNEEITPASIPLSLKANIEKSSKELYQVLNLSGIVRFDYINSLNGLYFLEVNTVPGMSSESIIPQQIREMGLTVSEVFDWVLA